MRVWTTGLAATVVVLAATTPIKAQADELLELRVLTINEARVAGHVLKSAEHEASRIFAAVGIGLAWNSNPHHVKVRIISDSPDNRIGRKLGVALRSEDNRYLVAYAFYFHIEYLADQIGADPAPLLGHVIAHELGHLLLPYDSHTSSGIMGRGWDRGRVKDMGKRLLAFTPEHATLMRARVRALLTR